jgi:hypothetical protein
VKGADFAVAGGDASHCNGHGTHVLYTVAAAAPPWRVAVMVTGSAHGCCGDVPCHVCNIGGSTYGVAKQATLVSVWVFECNGGATTATASIISTINPCHVCETYCDHLAQKLLYCATTKGFSGQEHRDHAAVHTRTHARPSGHVAHDADSLPVRQRCADGGPDLKAVGWERRSGFRVHRRRIASHSVARLQPTASKARPPGLAKVNLQTPWHTRRAVTA